MTLDPRPVSLRTSVLVLVSLAGVAASLTALFLGMRAVMDIGGACASGGPYVPVQPCPAGVPLLVVGGIWVGLIFAGIYAFTTAGTNVPSFAGLFWPGLFVSLGWNFLDYAVRSPGGEGIVWGWLIPGVLFMIMGGVPLAWVVRSFGSPPRGPGLRGLVPASPAGARGIPSVLRRTPDPGADLVGELERLDALRRSGAIDETEFRSAKRRLLEGGNGS